MSEWKEVSLGNFCSIGSSKRIFYSEYTETGVPFWRSKEVIAQHDGGAIDDPLYISEERYAELKKYGYPSEGDLLLTSVGTIGVPYLVKASDRFYFKDGNLTWFKDFSENLDSRYLYLFFESHLGQGRLNGLLIGSSQKALTISALNTLQIPLPPIEIQKRIAGILSAYDKLIENNRKQIALLEEAAQRLYKEWFVDLRFPGYESVELDPKTNLPKGWQPNSPIGHLIKKLESGKRPKGGIDKNLVSGIPSIGAENVLGVGRYTYASEKLIPIDYFESMSLGVVRDKDIMVYKDGAYTGRVSIVQDGFPYEKCAVNEHVFLVATEKETDQYWLYFTLERESIFNAIQKIAISSAQPGINKDDFKSIRTLIPTGSLRKMYSQKVSTIISQIIVLAKQNHAAECARDRLLPKLMSGEIEVM